MKELKIYLVVFLVSGLIALYLFESYITYNLNQPEVNIEKSSAIYSKEKNLIYDRRSKYEIYDDFILQNKNITTTVAPTKFNDPEKNLHFLSGASKKMTIDCNENGYYSVYKSDRFGFNNPDNEWDKENIEYFLLGDSFTHGACVNRPNDISSILRSLSSRAALNLGYKANGPLSMYATMKEYLPKNTKYVLWLYFEGNDFEDLKSELSTDILKNYYLDKNFKQNLITQQKYIDKKNSEIVLKTVDFEDNITHFIRKNSDVKNKILKFIRLNQSKKIIKSLSKKDKIPITEFKNIIISAKEFALKNNSKFYFIYLPQYERYNKSIRNNNYNIVKSIVKDLDLKFIDLHEEVFIKEEDPLKLFPFRMWGHYNEDGYQKIGKKIYTKIKNEKY